MTVTLTAKGNNVFKLSDFTEGNSITLTTGTVSMTVASVSATTLVLTFDCTPS